MGYWWQHLTWHQKVMINVTNKQNRWVGQYTLPWSRWKQRGISPIPVISYWFGNTPTPMSPQATRWSSTISLLSGDKSEALWLRRHRAASLSTCVASPFTVFKCASHCWERASRSEKTPESNAGFSHRVNHKAWDRSWLLHSPPLPNSWQTWTVGSVAASQRCLPHSERWAKPWVC